MSLNTLSTGHFTVEWGGTRIGATEVIGLGIEIETIKYREGGDRVNSERIMPGLEKPKTITLRRGIIKGDNEYFEWLSTVRSNTVERRDLTISLLNEAHEPVVVWKLKNAFPSKIEWSPLQANESEAAIESLEVIYERLDVRND